MKADLHNHTTHSDGTYSVEEVILRGKEKGLSMIAITDHDNIDSYEDYLKLKDNLDIDVLIGVELSTWYMNDNVHILGYFYNNSDIGEELIAFLKDMRLKRVERAKKMIANLKEFYDIDVDYDVIASSTRDIIARPHIARFVAEKYNMGVQEVFDKYLAYNRKAYVPSSNTTSQEAIDLLHRNNAIAVWAHPVLNKGKFNELDIIKMGIDGIEGLYPANTLEDTKHYRELANEYELLFTAGSDFHDDVSHSDIGTCYIEDEDIKKFVKKLNLK